MIAAGLWTAFWEWGLAGTVGSAGRIEWGAPAWTVLVAGLFAVSAWGLSWRGQRANLARVVEAILWGMSLACVVVALAQPVWVEESGRKEPARLAVLVDASRSMSILEGGRPRSESADTLVRSLDSQIPGAPEIDLYHFGADLRAGQPSTYDLPGTDLEGALAALNDRNAGEPLAGVVVITDGIDRGLMRKRYAVEKEPAGPPALSGPLTIFQVGRPGDLKDLSVRSIDSGGYGFVRSPLALTAHIEGVGFGGRSFQATLLRDGQPVTSTRVTLDKDGKGKANFEVRPDVPGRFTYAVSVPVPEDDAVQGNNSMPVVVRIVRDRIRVLQVAGTPSWDVKFLRRFLKGDPSIDLVSFFILRTNSDLGADYSDQELSLIPFPYVRLFSEDLNTFDLVIFQNFDYKPFFTGGADRGIQLLSNIRDFVKKDGHAFAMVGGDRSFDLGDYADTPISEILPLELGVPPSPSDRECRGLCSPDPFVPRLTAEGERHPLTRLDADPVENEAWWKRLHPADGTNLSLGPAKGAAVLLSHPSARTGGGQPLPVLAVKEAGKGRVMALTLDSSWRWSFSEAAEGRGNQAYLRFWKNAFRWLVADPTASRVTVETPRENYALGETVRLVVRARDPGFAPVAGAQVQAVIQGNGEKSVIAGRTGSDGDVVLEWPADRRGAQRVSVTVKNGEEQIGSADTVFAVTTRDPELDQVIPDEAFLRWVAASAGGRYFGPGESGPVLRDENAGRTVLDRRETPLWRAPLLLAGSAVLAGLAWIVRRRAGLR